MSDAITAPAPAADAASTTPHDSATITNSWEIDLERLTEKVYRLMLSDLRQEQARRGGQR